LTENSVDDMAYGKGGVSTKDSAQDAAALNVWDREDMAQSAAAQNTSDIHTRESQHRRSRHYVERMV
jgi:hypothetical protein